MQRKLAEQENRIVYKSNVHVTYEVTT